MRILGIQGFELGLEVRPRGYSLTAVGRMEAIWMKPGVPDLVNAPYWVPMWLHSRQVHCPLYVRDIVSLEHLCLPLQMSSQDAFKTWRVICLLVPQSSYQLFVWERTLVPGTLGIMVTAGPWGLVNWIQRSWGSLNWGEFLFFRFCSTPIRWPSSRPQEMAALPLLLVTLLLGDVPGHWPKSLSNNRWAGGGVRLACFFLTHERKPLSLWVPTGWWMERVHHYVFNKEGSWATSSHMILESWMEAVWLTDHSSLTMRFHWASLSASLTWVILDFSPLQLVH